jgi:hypothetical protein
VSAEQKQMQKACHLLHLQSLFLVVASASLCIRYAAAAVQPPGSLQCRCGSIFFHLPWSIKHVQPWAKFKDPASYTHKRPIRNMFIAAGPQMVHVSSFHF